MKKLILTTIAIFALIGCGGGGSAGSDNNKSIKNSKPQAKSQNITLHKNSPKTITLKASDKDGDKLTFTIVSNPKHGVLSGKAPSLTYTPNNNFTGDDSFTFKVNDGEFDSNIAKVSLHINPQNANSFPATYYPSKAHPRLWLEQDRLDVINNEKNNNTQKWQDFKSFCDSMIDNDSSNDPYRFAQDPQNFTAPLALMYILTNDNRYANKALELMDKIDTDLSRYGDPDHQSWYFIALTYDWLYNYSGMSSARKSNYKNLMHTLSDKFWNGLNASASGTDSDQNLLTAQMHLAFGAALYGDDSDATTLLDRAWYGWVRGYYTDHGTSNKDTILSALGGVYFTGMAYFPSTDIIGIASFEMTLKSACNYDINTQESALKPFWANTIKAIIALTEPNREWISNYGSWQDPNKLSEQSWLRRAMIILDYFAYKAGDSSASALAKGYYENVDIGYNNDYFLELFFSNPNTTPQNPYSANLEKIAFFDNPDFLLFRSGWGTSDSWGEFRGDGSIPMDQQAPDHGHFSLYKNGSFLTKAARNYEALSHGDFFNTLSIQNNCSYNGSSCSGTAIFDSKGSAQITRHIEHNSDPIFAYAMLQADDQWDDNPNEYNPTDNVKTYRRHFFWTPKYTIVFDRVRGNKKIDIRYRLRALKEPTINGNIVTQLSENSQAKLIQKTLEPSNVTIHKLNEKDAWSNVPTWVVDDSQRAWQSYIDFNQTDSLNILNVLQAGDSNLNTMDATEHIQNSYEGVKIGDWVVLFSADEQLNTTLSYTLHNSKKKLYHLIGDLESGTYAVVVNGTNIGTFTATDSTKSIFFQTDSSKETMTVEVSKQ